MGPAPPKLTFDTHKSPGLWAENPAQAYYGLGWLHGRYRPTQVWLMHTAARGELAGRLMPRQQLLDLDALVHRLNIPQTSMSQVRHLESDVRPLLQAYVQGLHAGLQAVRLPWELRLLAARLALPDLSSVLGSLMLGAFLGLAQGQERMERALVEAVRHGAQADLLRRMFAPHLDGVDFARYPKEHSQPACGFAGVGFVGLGGSNAWAVSGARSAGDSPMLCGDPHLQINQLPALFFEARVRVGNDYWLGATIPGLPGFAVGRNRHVAWTGTFGVADNVDYWWEDNNPGATSLRTAKLKRRWQKPLELTFRQGRHGQWEDAHAQASAVLASRWAAGDNVAEALGAYVRLPLAKSAAEAESILHNAHTMSLHFVLADRSGDIRYKQAGRIPKRAEGWSGLWPGTPEKQYWTDFYEGQGLPTAGATDGMIISANEARLAPDGGVLATLAQPSYRMDRIRALLMATPRHDVRSMQAMQKDLYSLQAEKLRPLFVEHLPPGALRDVLVRWDLGYQTEQAGPHAFKVARDAALDALGHDLGGEWFAAMRRTSELDVWWAHALDTALSAPSSWQGARGRRLRTTLANVADVTPAAWKDVQRFRLQHMVFGGLPLWLGLDRGEFALPGSLATVSQGNCFTVDKQPMAVGPAYRWICDLSEDVGWSSLPGGMDGSPFGESYVHFLDEWLEGAYHRVAPPTWEENNIGLA